MLYHIIVSYYFKVMPNVNRLMKEIWTKHVSLGNNLAVFLSRNRNNKVEYKAIILAVDPDLDDDSLKQELEERNSLKLTNIYKIYKLSSTIEYNRGH